MKQFIKYIALSALALSLFACTKSFKEVNTDPDRPGADLVPSTNVLAYAERYASDNLFDEWFDLNESCGFSGQIAKWMYTEEGYYDFRPNVNDNSWAICYLVAANLQAIIDREAEGSNMWAAATIFQCNIFQIISDRWGNVPYSEAGKLAKEGISSPKYDKQSDIYPDLLKRLKAAVAALDESGDALGAGDVMLGGDIALWKKYGNALRLRIAARIAAIDPTHAQTAFEEIAAAGIPADNDDNIFFSAWGNEYGEPWADYYLTRQQEYGISSLMVNTLKNLSDPRLPVYACQTADFVAGVAGAEEYAGYQVGKKATASPAKCSKLGDRFMKKDGLDGFSPWLRSCEPYFAISYAASKGWNAGMTQKAAYEKAVTLSLKENGIDDAAIAAYLAGAGAYDGSQEQLFTQWWISLYKNGQEAWSVYRMSGYPAGNVIAPDSKYPEHDVPPMAYSYPDTEANLNNVNYAPEAAAEIDYFWGKKMWWDVRAHSARDYNPAP